MERLDQESGVTSWLETSRNIRYVVDGQVGRQTMNKFVSELHKVCECAESVAERSCCGKESDLWVERFLVRNCRGVTFSWRSERLQTHGFGSSVF